jgi:hypothetical protein
VGRRGVEHVNTDDLGFVVNVEIVVFLVHLHRNEERSKTLSSLSHGQ